MSLWGRDVTNEESTERAMRSAYQSQADGEHVGTQSLVCWLAYRNRSIVCFAGLAARTLRQWRRHGEESFSRPEVNRMLVLDTLIWNVQNEEI